MMRFIRTTPFAGRRPPVPALIIAFLGFLSLLAPLHGQDEDPERMRIAVETLKRLPKVDLDKNPKLKSVVTKVLDSTRGTADFVNLVQKFAVIGQEEGLLEYAVQHPADETGVTAMRLVLGGDNHAALLGLLAGSDTTNAVGAVEALGNTKESQAVTYLLPLVSDEKKEPALRKTVVRALVRSEHGAKALLDLARGDRLPADLKFTAGAELSAVRWPEIRTASAEVLPPPPGQNSEPLPPLGALLQMSGDPARGRQVFQRELSQCAACHRVRGEGKEVGPDLSEIGAKLGKDALYEAILDPSAGVSFGFEAYELELKSGDEAFGLIVSETPEEIALKDTQAIVTRYAKSAVIGRRQMKLSIMPAGLQLTMSTQDLVDLVEFLSSLK